MSEEIGEAKGDTCEEEEKRDIIEIDDADTLNERADNEERKFASDEDEEEEEEEEE